MPFLDVILPGLHESEKQTLARRLNDEFVNATGFEDETLYVRFAEYQSNQLSIGGKIPETGYICFHLYCPRLRHDVKRGVAAGFLEAVRVTEALSGCASELYLHEFPYENLAKDGQLMTDADEELSSRPFYYVLPR